MVEIRYSDNYEVANLAGQSIAEAREQFRTEFGIPDKARAKLNGKKVKEELESETRICDDDKLSFAEARGRGAYLVGALLLALAITGGLFAYTYTTASVTLSLVTGTADFASVTANTTGAALSSYQPWGRYRGSIPAGTPFDVVIGDGFTGDVEIDVYLSNLDELSRNYAFYLMRFALTDGDNVTVDEQMAEKPLTLKNGVVQFYLPSANYTNYASDNQVFYLRMKGGCYYALPFSKWVGGTIDPILYAQVKQAGLD